MRIRREDDEKEEIKDRICKNCYSSFKKTNQFRVYCSKACSKQQRIDEKRQKKIDTEQERIFAANKKWIERDIHEIEKKRSARNRKKTPSHLYHDAEYLKKFKSIRG